MSSCSSHPFGAAHYSSDPTRPRQLAPHPGGRLDSKRLNNWKKWIFAACLVLGLAGFISVPFIVGVKDMLKTVGQVGPVCVIGYTIVASLVIIMPALGWWIMMRAEGIPVTIMQAVKAALMGAPLNFFFPSAHLGGDPVKMVYIARVAGVTKRRVLATIVASKLQELAALIGLMVVAAVYFVLHSGFLTPMQETLLLAGMGLLGIGLVLLVAGFVFDWKPTVKLLTLLARFGVARRRMIRMRSWAKDMERIVRATLVHRWKSSLVAQAVVSISALSILLRPYFFYHFLGGTPAITFADCCMIYVIVNFLNTISFVPGGLGLMEGGVVGYFAAVGLGDHNGLALQMLNRISDAVQVMLGLWLIVHYGLTSVARGVAKGTETIQEKDLREAADAEERGQITRLPGQLDEAAQRARDMELPNRGGPKSPVQ